MSTRAKNDGDLDVIVKDVAALKSDIGMLAERVKNGATETVTHEARRLYDSLAAEGERSAAALSRQVEGPAFCQSLDRVCRRLRWRADS